MALETGEETELSPALAASLQKQIDDLKKDNKPVGFVTPEGANDIGTAEAIKLLVEQLKVKPDSEIYGQNKYVNIEDIDEDDRLKEPVMFFAHKVGFIIVDDMRNGHPVQTPFRNTLIFDYDSTRRIVRGKETDLQNLCIYKCFSKKEAQWLRDSSFYGVYIFDRVKSALSADASKASHLARHMTALKEIGQHRLVEMMKSNGLDVLESVNDMRVALATHHADIDVAAERVATQSRNAAALEESLTVKTAQATVS